MAESADEMFFYHFVFSLYCPKLISVDISHVCRWLFEMEIKLTCATGPGKNIDEKGRHKAMFLSLPRAQAHAS